MYKGWFTKIFGTQFQRELKRIRPIVDAIHRHEARLKGLSDGELQAQTPKLRGLIAERTSTLAAEVERLKREKHDCPDADQRVELSQELSQAEAAYGKALQVALNDVLPEAFATVRDDGRGQDARGDSAAVPERARGTGRPSRHRQQLPRPS